MHHENTIGKWIELIKSSRLIYVNGLHQQWHIDK